MESKETVQQYYTFYVNNKSLLKTVKHFHKCGKSLKKFFIHYGFEYPLKDFNKKHTYNENYFEIINTEAKAYFLGFIFADGNIFIRKRKYRVEKSFRINLAEEDKHILESLKKELNHSAKLFFIEGKKFISPINNKEYKRKNQYALYISSSVFVQHLINLGLGNRKTYMSLSIPNIPDTLMRHFIRGYFDGDGCSHGKFIYFTSKTKSLLEELQTYFRNKFNLPFGTIRKTNRDVYIWSFCTEKSVFLNYLYQNSNYYLHRKYPHGQLKQGELLETPEKDNQQPSLSSNTLEGSTTNNRVLPDNAGDSNVDTSALQSFIKNQKPLNSEFNQIISENFWDLI